MIESSGHGKAKPVVTIALDGGRLVFGVNSALCRCLSDDDWLEILDTLHRIITERRR
jgi:hypothetical protein